MIKIGLTDFTPTDKIIDIRDKKDIIKAKYAVSATDVLKHTLMSEHCIEISFSYDKSISFKRSDYIVWNGERFTLRQDYIPEQVNKLRYNYTLKFEATEMLFQDVQFYYLNQNLKESDWRLAGNPEYFIKIAADNANRYFGVTDFQVGIIEPSEVKDIIFSTDTNTFNALTQIAEAYESEWYLTGKTINLVKKISIGSEIDFENEVSILSMSRLDGENSNRYTRILALGSDRNIPKNYRKVTAGNGVDAIYPKRLRIPTSKGDVIDAYPNMSAEEVIEGTVIFDDVYPKRVGTIEAVDTIEYEDTDEDTGEVTKWNAFKIKDSGISFKEEYLLQDTELRLIFQSGDLNGFDFALRFYKDKFSNTDNSQYFEIVRSEDYGKNLPNNVMKPKVGDKYVLYGFDIALVSDQYVQAGEQELFEKASNWLSRQLKDKSVYTCTTAIDHFKKNEMDLDIGQKIKLIKSTGISRNLLPNSSFESGIGESTFANGAKISRVQGGYNGTYSMKVMTSDNSHSGYCWQNLPTEKGLEYTISCYVKADTAITGIAFGVYEKSWKWITNSTLNIGTEWKRISVRFIATDSLMRMCVLKSNVTFYVDCLQLEKGNRLTDWNPAPEDFESGVRSSRIMGYEKKLLNKYDATYTVGDNSAYSRLASIEKNLKELQHAGIVYQNNGSGGVYLIKQFDATNPSDFNAYSAKASNAKYFNKQTGGGIQGDTLFQKNMQVQGIAISDVFQNSTFTAGQLGSGFQIKRDANGQSYMELDNLMVRRETVFNRLTIAEIKSVGGAILLSLANMIVSKVENKTSSWKCYFDNLEGTVLNDFAVNDQVICRKFSGRNIKYYWSKVISVGSDFIEISKTDKDGTGIPTAGDEIVQLGNRSDVNRQYAIMLSAYGSDAPSIKQYAGINSYDLTGKEVTSISPKGNKFTGSFTVSTNGTTAPIYKERGVFTNGNTYYLNDRISYLGSYWVCIVNTTNSTPNETNLAWRKETTGQTDINNAVENIKVGGRNCIRNTNKGVKDWGTTIANGVNKLTEVEALGVKAFKLTCETTSTYYHVIWHNILRDLIKNDTQYTISMDVYAEYDTTMGVSIRNTDGLNILLNSINADIKKNTWQKIELTGTTTSNITTNQVLYLAGFNKIGSVTFANLKLEEGNKATAWTPASEDIQADVNDAQEVANQAKKNATAANSLLADIANDNKLVPSEKQDTKKEWDAIISEYAKNKQQASQFSVSSDAYTTAYNALSSYIIPLLANLGTTSDIVGSTFRTTFKAYYDARTDILNAIATKTKELANAAQTSANNAQGTANRAITDATNARSAANNAQKDANGANSLLADIANDNKLVPTEKQSTKKEWDTIISEYIKNKQQATLFNISSEAYTSAYNALNIYITPLLANLSITSDITGSTFRANFKAYYDARTNLLNAISTRTKELANAAQTSANNAQTTASQAKTEAQNAQNAANNAKKDASEANSLLADIANDNKLVPSEKQDTKKEWDVITSEYTKNKQQAIKFNVSSDAYTAAYNALNSYITPLLANLGITSNIEGPTFRATFKTYYDARIDLLNILSSKAKELADKAQVSANSAQGTANQAKTDATNAQNTANNAQKDADGANSLLEDIANDNKLVASEKQYTKKEWDTISSEYTKNKEQASKFNVSSAAYTTAYNKLNSYITPLLANLATTSDIVGTTFRANFKAYYDARTDLLNNLSDKAKELAEKAQKEAEKVRSEFKSDFVILDTKIASKVSQQDFNSLGQRVSSSESNITQLSNSITSTVEAVKNIVVGGRNYLPNTNQGIKDWGRTIANGTNTLTEVEALGVKAFKLTCSVPSTYYHVIWHNILRKLIKNNTQYTISMDVYAEYDTTMGLSIRNADGLNILLNFSNADIKNNTWQKIELTGTTNSETTTNQVLYIAGLNKVGSITIANLKLEEGNKATAWTPALEDVQTEIKNVQSIAENKNKTYISDEKPAIPSGGHKTGDIWYKESLVDSSGNKNADTSRNIYQLQYRWNGTEWIQINWSASKSKIEQTDDRISRIVERTGIDEYGSDKTLKSLIDQTPENIRLAVSEVKVGGRNCIPNTNEGTKDWGTTIENGTNILTEVKALGVSACKLTCSVPSTGYHVVWHNILRSLIKNDTQYTISMDVYTEYDTAMVVSIRNTNGVNILAMSDKINVRQNNWQKVEVTVKTNSDTTVDQVLYMTGFNKIGSVIFANLKLEEGNKATSWSPAAEDVQAKIDSKTTLDEVKAGITITADGVNLFGKTFTVDSDLIAKAISAQNLEVVSKDGKSALKVFQNGTFYAKGSNPDGSSMIIDSGAQSIKITSYIDKYTSDKDSTKVLQTTTIDAYTGKFISQNSDFDSAYISSQGIFSNRAGIEVLSPFSGTYIKAAIVGLGNSHLDTLKWGPDWTIAGVYGRADNNTSNPAPAYGGYFDVLKANGLCMACKRTDSSITLTRKDCYVSCYNSSLITVTLPPDPYVGQIIYIRKIYDVTVRISSKINIHGSTNLGKSTNARGVNGDVTQLVYDGQYWCLNWAGR